MITRANTPQVRVRAPGKVNLGLDVGRRGSDGYHALTTVFQAVSVYEDLTAHAAPNFAVTVSGRQADRVPLDGRNLALRAAKLLAHTAGIDHGAHLHIEKNVPVAGGMAGGSADAAAALVACDALWDAGLSREELLELAAELGSDVPFALLGHTALGVGRGDQLSPVMVRGTYHWTFALTETGLSTPEVFQTFDKQEPRVDTPDPASLKGIMDSLRAGDAELLGSYLRNDLQEAAFELAPHLRPIVDLALREGALGAIVSGSGPAIAILARSPQQSLDLSIALTASGLVSDVVRAVGPVPGTRVVEAIRGEDPDTDGPPRHREEDRPDRTRRPLGPV